MVNWTQEKKMRVRKPAPISQVDLQVIEDLRREKENLSHTLKEVEAQLAARERKIIEGLAQGVRVRAGRLLPVVEEKTICSPSYKEELIAHFEQAHGIDGKLVEQQVQARWCKVKQVLRIVQQVANGVR
jgi:hypothetical protein